MSKGDHSRNWAYKLSQAEFVKRIDEIDWTDPEADPPSIRVCIDCKAEKPSGKWCTTCDRDTDSERVYA